MKLIDSAIMNTLKAYHGLMKRYGINPDVHDGYLYLIGLADSSSGDCGSFCRHYREAKEDMRDCELNGWGRNPEAVRFMKNALGRNYEVN